MDINNLVKVNRVSNYAGHVKWIADQYEENSGGLAHGFQKEAIQNSTGARTSSSFANWRCEISIINNEKGQFLIVEDFGTTGLTGHNYSSEELEEMVRNKELDNKPEERLARLSCDNVSGGDAFSAGLFGVGKTMYIAASKVMTYCFESISVPEGYRCNINEVDKMFPKALEGEEAKEYIRERTGLEPINHTGTRFIILDPDEKIVDAILGDDQNLMKYIEETWWRVIRRLPPESGIFLQGKKAGIPAEYTFDEKDNLFEKDSYFNRDPIQIEPGYRLKKFGFFIKKDLPDYLCGFYYYRRGMKIGLMNLKELESHIPENYVGFIEVDTDWEDELAKLENGTHYGIKGNSRNTNTYQYLQKAVKTNVEDCLREWGYLKDEQSSNKALRDLVDSIKQDIIETLSENGYENIARGDRHSTFDVRLKNVVYPRADEPKYERSVYTNDKITFDFQIINRTYRTCKYVARLSTKSADGSLKTTAEERMIVVKPGEPALESVVFEVTGENSLQNSRNALILSVFNANGTGKVVEKKLYYYYGIETDVKPGEDFKLDIERHDFPRVNDRRVNTGEAVRNIQYSIENNLPRPIKMFLHIYTLNTENNNEKIEDIDRREYIVSPFGEEFISEPVDVVFKKDVYLPKLKKGIVEVRAALILGENVVEKQMGKTKRIDDYSFKVFFNKPERSGLDFPYDLVQSDRHTRSWETNNTVYINIGHPEFLQCSTMLEQSRYIALQYLKQVIMIYAQTGTLDKDLLGPDGSANNIEYVKNLEEKIEDLWYKQCQK